MNLRPQSRSVPADGNAAADSASLPYPLRQYQLEGIQFLMGSSSALLADEMGLGKTVQVAVALKLGRRQYRRVLIVAPTSLCLNWQRELETWSPELVVRRVVGRADDRAFTYRLPVQVLIASYEQIRQDSGKFDSAVQFDLVVLDEAQRIKNINSETSLACRIIPRSNSWALTGTPLENHPRELAAVFRFLQPRLVQAGMSRPEIHQAMAGHFLRRTKADVLKDLPPIMHRNVRLEFGDQQRRTYDKLWEERLETVSGPEPRAMIANMLALLTRLKLQCNFDLASDESVKLDVMRPMLEEIVRGQQKVLIFSQYVGTLEWLSSRIEMTSDLFHGGLSVSARDEVLRSFREAPGPRALLLSLQAGGVGLNLQEAAMVILFDRWWNPALEDQAVQRAHRYGRTTPLEVVSFVVENTVEERIIEVLREKRNLFDEYVEGAPQQPPQQTEQLKQILQLV